MSEKQAYLDFKCKKILHGVDDKSTVCQTPEKTSEPMHPVSDVGRIQVPDKYKDLAALFHSMNCSLRLLSLCKKSPTFMNVSTQIEILSKRNFSHKHLAQIIYIIPEVVLVDKILIHDKKTLCMKPDIRISVSFDVVDGHCEKSPYTALQKVFSAMLIDFYINHPQAIDVPEAVLPKPYCGSFLDTGEDTVQNSSSKLLPVKEQEEKIDPFISKLGSRNQQKKDSTAIIHETQSELKNEAPSSNSKSVPECPVQPVPTQLPVLSSTSTSESPAIKSHSSTDNIMIETPVQSTPRRLIPTPDVQIKVDIAYHNSTSSTAKRVLDFSHSEGDERTTDKIGSTGIFRKTGGFILDDVVNKSVPSQTEQGANFRFHNGSNNAPSTLETNQHLSRLVAVIHSVFRSVSWCTITKEELLHKIIMNSLDFTERREVEEQVELLEKAVPHWICKKLLPSGDIMYSIDRSSNLDSVRSRLLIM